MRSGDTSRLDRAHATCEQQYPDGDQPAMARTEEQLRSSAAKEQCAEKQAQPWACAKRMRGPKLEGGQESHDISVASS